MLIEHSMCMFFQLSLLLEHVHNLLLNTNFDLTGLHDAIVYLFLQHFFLLVRSVVDSLIRLFQNFVKSHESLLLECQIIY